MKKPKMPTTVTTVPIMAKMALQLEAFSKSKNMKPPNTTKMLTSGIMALIPSAAPRLVGSVESVSHALKAASLALEPKKVMTQSRMMVRLTPSVAAETIIEAFLDRISSRRKIKLKIERPHRI